MTDLHLRDEALKSQRNRIDTYLFLRSQSEASQLEHLCITILEDISEYQQTIFDNYCVKGEA